ncbi:hypothetical protein [Dyella sp.]|uniref:hypothetical protein n=1 Tax=Dyella sp. TaxID=1869338 RepID=UPI0028488CC1|nr:hypothetical protein [Dyella sp.]MDR3446690.1 hypothetical protein [Dyella sp.]
MKVLIAAASFLGATSMCWAQQTGSTDEYHRGYLWAHMHNVDNTSTCAGISESFGEGCIAFIADKRVAMSGIGGSTMSLSENPTPGGSLHDRKDACVASIRLEKASNQLARCARSIESIDGCASEYRDVREAFSRYSDMSRSAGEACK